MPGAIAAAWQQSIRVVACRVCETGIVPACDGFDPNVNHFVLATQIDTSVEGIIIIDDDDAVKEAIASRDVIDHTDQRRGQIAEFYARHGMMVHFTAAQGDCAPDTIAHYSGAPSTPLSWKSIRQRVAGEMRALRNADWFRTCFQVCQEYDPRVLDQPLDDAVDVDVSETEPEAVRISQDCIDAPNEEKRCQHAALRFLLGKVSGVQVGERSVPASTLDGYVRRMSAEELSNAIAAHTAMRKAPLKGPRCPKYKPAALPVRVATGHAYKDFLRGEKTVLKHFVSN